MIFLNQNFCCMDIGYYYRSNQPKTSRDVCILSNQITEEDFTLEIPGEIESFSIRNTPQTLIIYCGKSKQEENHFGIFVGEISSASVKNIMFQSEGIIVVVGIGAIVVSKGDTFVLSTTGWIKEI